MNYNVYHAECYGARVITALLMLKLTYTLEPLLLLFYFSKKKPVPVEISPTVSHPWVHFIESCSVSEMSDLLCLFCQVRFVGPLDVRCLNFCAEPNSTLTHSYPMHAKSYK